MHASEESFDEDAGALEFQDDLAVGDEGFAAAPDTTERKDFGYRMKARRRLEQLREERELARLLRTGFDQ